MLRCAAVGAVPVRAVGPFRRVRGQALLPLAPHVMLGWGVGVGVNYEGVAIARD